MYEFHVSRNRPHHRAPKQLILVALVHVIRGLNAATILGFLVATFLLKEPQLLIGAVIATACLILVGGIHLAEAPKMRCPVCTTAIFAPTGCRKHKTARRILGSYRLHSAAEILTSRLFHCHHCGEGVVCRPKATAKEEPSTRRSPHRREAKTLARVPIERIPDRNAPIPATLDPRARTTSEGPTLPS